MTVGRKRKEIEDITTNSQNNMGSSLTESNADRLISIQVFRDLENTAVMKKNAELIEFKKLTLIAENLAKEIKSVNEIIVRSLQAEQQVNSPVTRLNLAADLSSMLNKVFNEKAAEHQLQRAVCHSRVAFLETLKKGVEQERAKHWKNVEAYAKEELNNRLLREALESQLVQMPNMDMINQSLSEYVLNGGSLNALSNDMNGIEQALLIIEETEMTNGPSASVTKKQKFGLFTRVDTKLNSTQNSIANTPSQKLQ